jgi:hypothetical protein
LSFISPFQNLIGSRGLCSNIITALSEKIAYNFRNNKGMAKFVPDWKPASKCSKKEPRFCVKSGALDQLSGIGLITVP